MAEHQVVFVQLSDFGGDNIPIDYVYEDVRLFEGWFKNLFEELRRCPGLCRLLEARY